MSVKLPGESPYAQTANVGFSDTDSRVSGSQKNVPDGSAANDASSKVLKVALGGLSAEESPFSQPLDLSEKSVRVSSSGISQQPAIKSRIMLAALKLWSVFSAKGETAYQSYLERHLDYGAHVSALHSRQINARKPYDPNVAQAGECLVVDSNIVLTPRQIRRPFTEHKAAAEHAKNRSDLYTKVESFPVYDQGSLEAYGYSQETGALAKGQVVPSSYWIGGAEQTEQNHIMNIYVLLPNKGAAVIRSSKIDSQQKADELVELLTAIRDEIRAKSNNPSYQLRVCSSQFNSYDLGRETSMIDNQHAWLDYANEKMKKGGVGELLHISTPLNSFHFISKQLRKFGVVGKFLEKHLIYGEIRSKEQNVDSWGTYLRWVNEDTYKAMAEIEDSDLMDLEITQGQTLGQLYADYTKNTQIGARKIVDLQKEISETLAEIRGCKQKLAIDKMNFKKAENRYQREAAQVGMQDARRKLRRLHAELKDDRVSLRNALEAQHALLAQLDDGLRQVIEANKDVEQHLAPIREPLFLIRQVLASQLEIPQGGKSSRQREMLMLQELNERLGVVSQGNCKGGLDRTAIWHAAFLSMKGLKQTGNADTLHMVSEWDTATKKMNIMIGEMGHEAFYKMVADKQADARLTTAEKELFRQVIEFRKLVLDNMIRIGLPITERSTGLQGFKWSPDGYKENKMPLNLLPSHIEMDGVIVPMVAYGKRGQALGLTPEGSRVLAKFQGMRGS